MIAQPCLCSFESVNVGIDQSRNQCMLRPRDSQNISFISLNWLAAANIGDETILNNDETFGDKIMSIEDFDVFDNETVVQ